MKQMNETEFGKLRNRDREMSEMKRSLMMRGIVMVGGVPVHRSAAMPRKA